MFWSGSCCWWSYHCLPALVLAWTWPSTPSCLPYHSLPTGYSLLCTASLLTPLELRYVNSKAFWHKSQIFFQGLISTTTARKISVLVASLVPALCLLAICLVGKNVVVVVILTILAVMFYGSMFSGVFSNQSDLAPNFAGTLMAVTNMLATIPGKIIVICNVFASLD